ncbi:helix-turn-helix domain-containing protein [Cognataquiflexum rubidum]|uniref:AlbA family DNA-binding domain-containing protein n=1 Tax=Cognataquiflexum rubidum TaxID=2922273 RepID=UPI001F12C22B|nr:ATP-binding protein [Cognataquiflexum rubidum]MCH6233574.1 ATP-binding protein [Cognataquiflexum rubidum]
MLLPKKNEEFLKYLLNRKEGQTIDFKQSITSSQKLAKTLVAFANTEGGIILIGVSDKKKIIGVDPEEEVFMVEKALFENCDPHPTLRFELLETIELSEKNVETEKYVLLVVVEKSIQKHYFKNQSGEKIYYKRLYDQTIPDTTESYPNSPPTGN